VYISAIVEGVERFGGDVLRCTVKLERPLSSAPGQFVMLWVPRVGEIPLSVALEEGARAHLIIARKGRVTGYLYDNLREGARLFVRGPFGRGFTVRGGSALLVGGGVGVAPLIHLARALSEAGARVTAAVGFRSGDYLGLADRLGRYADELYVATEDGSAGVRGTAVGLAAPLLERTRYDVVYVCGREAMVRQIVELALSGGLEVEASLERLIKCGIGICGSCALEPLGLRVCREGPVFSGRVLVQLEDFGRWWRDAAGRRVPI